MAYEKNNNCDECGKELNFPFDTYVCSYEFTFCSECSEKANFICKHCKEELLPHPEGNQSE